MKKNKLNIIGNSFITKNLKDIKFINGENYAKKFIEKYYK